MASSEEAIREWNRIRGLLDTYLRICETIKAGKLRIHGLDFKIPKGFELKLKARCEEIKLEIRKVLDEILES